MNRKEIRQALRAWEKTEVLGQSPFAALAIVERRRVSEGYAETAVGLGIAVRGLLQDTINQLRPDDGVPEPREKRWRHYIIVTEQYIEGRSREYLADKMHIAESTYAHEQAAALDRMLDQVRVWEETGGALGTASDEARDAPRVASAVPFMAPPAPTGGLVGRAGLVDTLKRWLLDEAGPRRLALHGLPGVGKTSLVAALCHDPRVREVFPDGVLWAGLGPAPEISVHLHLWEISLGFTSEELATLSLVEDRAKALHTAIGERALLIIVDDVWHAKDARLLEVGGPRCTYVYTTRMPGLATELANGATFHVPELDEQASLEMVGRLVPQLRDELKERGQELIRAVGGLPLALQLVGRATRQQAYAGNPRRLISELNRLSRAEERLKLEGHRSALEAQPGVSSDRPETLGGAIALSEQTVSASARGAFRRLSVFPPKPNSFAERAAERVAAQPAEVLDELVDAGLVEAAGQDRFSIHPVLSDYAALGLGSTSAEIALAEYSSAFIQEHQSEFPALDEEVTNLLAGLTTSAKLGCSREYIDSVNALFPYLDASGLIEQAQRHLLEAAQQAEKEALEDHLARTMVNLGRASQRAGEPADAGRWYRDGLRLARKHKDNALECSSLQGLGATASSQGQHDEARKLYETGLRLAQASNLVSLQSSLLSNLGTLADAMGDAASAERHYGSGLSLARTSGEIGMQSVLLSNLGAILAKGGQNEEARACLEESLELTRPSGNRRTMTVLLTNLGALANDSGERARAAELLLQALNLARQLEVRPKSSRISATHAKLLSSTNLGSSSTRREAANAW